jgi:NADPH-dependent ferric siderophore reductase
MTAIRKHVRHAWGLPRERVSLTPYWRHPGSPVPTDDDVD